MCCGNDSQAKVNALAGYYNQVKLQEESSEGTELLGYVTEDTPNANQINLKIFIENQEKQSGMQGINYFR